MGSSVPGQAERLPHLLLDQVAETKSNCECNREAGVTLRCSSLAGVSPRPTGRGRRGDASGEEGDHLWLISVIRGDWANGWRSCDVDKV